MDLDHAAADLADFLPRWVDRTQSQLEFSAALVRRIACARLSDGKIPFEEEALDQQAFDASDTKPGRSGSVLVPDAPSDPLPMPDEPTQVDATASEPLKESTGSSSVPHPTEGELPIPNYESLAAPQVIPRLQTLSTSELEMILTFEQENRHRRTILNSVQQLLAS